MTVFKGMLLFDVPEPAIGKWENQLGYRGMLEVWKHSKTGDCVVLEPYEDAPEECIWEFWIHDKDSYNCESISSGAFDQVDKEAKEWMRKHLEGWK